MRAKSGTSLAASWSITSKHGLPCSLLEHVVDASGESSTLRFGTIAMSMLHLGINACPVSIGQADGKLYADDVHVLSVTSLGDSDKFIKIGVDICSGTCCTSHYSSKISGAPEDWHLAEAGELQGDRQHF